MKFLVLGCNGMAGHLISLYLKERGYDVTGFARRKSQFVNTVVGDARDSRLIANCINEGNYSTVVNCIGMLNYNAENDHEAAAYLNGYFPHFLEKITRNSETQIIQISTDCIFSGNRGGYVESDIPDGKFFYDRSKAFGELNNSKDITFRMSIVGPDMNKEGIGLINWFMQQEGYVKGYKNAMWTGLTTLELAKVIEKAAIQRAHGLYNMVPDEKISKFDMLILFNRYLRINPIDIEPEANFRVDKSLIRTVFEPFSYEVPGYTQQIKELAEWMTVHKTLYPHYYGGGYK